MKDREVAEEIGVNRATANRWRHGKRRPRIGGVFETDRVVPLDRIGGIDWTADAPLHDDYSEESTS